MSCSEPPCKRLKSSEEKVLKGGCNELKGGRETGEQGTYQESGDDSVSIGLSESDVGISEHVSSHAGFFAILKRRYRGTLNMLSITLSLGYAPSPV